MMKPERLQISNIIRNIRKSLKLTQNEFALVLGVSRTTVARWEAGDRAPSFALLLHAAELLGVNLREYL